MQNFKTKRRVGFCPFSPLKFKADYYDIDQYIKFILKKNKEAWINYEIDQLMITVEKNIFKYLETTQLEEENLFTTTIKDFKLNIKITREKDFLYFEIRRA